MTSQSLVFPPFRLEPAEARLFRDTELITLRPKTFNLLHYLLDRAGELVTKDDLLATVWPDSVISEGGITEAVRELRRALGDDAKAPRFIETVHKRGYRFVGAVVREPLVPVVVDAPLSDPEIPTTCVGREKELALLGEYLERAAQGARQVVFVTGEPGIGKTTLLETFRRACANRTDGTPRYVTGQCIEQYGASEAYLPVMDALSRLMRDLGSAQELLPILVRFAPTWLVQLPGAITPAELETLQRRVYGSTRERMIREMAEALEAFTARRPLVLLLEDLHWSDYSTLDLLSFVAQRKETARLMVVATYRPVEVYTSDHPLKAVKQELQARGQCIEISLPCLNESAVGAYLAVRFGDSLKHDGLARVVYQRTEGHPLFMVNVADFVASQHDLRVADAVTHSIPDSVRQMIEKQIDRLDDGAQSLLEAASVAGAEFSVASVAAALENPDLDAVEQAFDRLARRAQFLQARGSSTWPDGTHCARFGFIHALYQNVLYFRVSPGRRARLHQRIGVREEHAFAERAGELATELASHFEQGQDFERALLYLRLAAERAVDRCANREAIELFRQGIALLDRLAPSRIRSRHALLLHVGLGVPLIHSKGYAAAEVGEIYARARDLHTEAGEPEDLLPVLWGLWLFYVVRGDQPVAYEIATQLCELETARGINFPWAPYTVGCSAFWLGRVTEGLASLEHGIANYSRDHHSVMLARYHQDPRTICSLYKGWCLWLLGQPDRALAVNRDALSWATTLGHPFSQAFAMGYTAELLCLRREPAEALALATAAIQLCEEQGFKFWRAWNQIICGWAHTCLGEIEVGIDELNTGLDDYSQTGAGMGRTMFLALLADAYLIARQVSAGLHAVEEALAFARKFEERTFEPELYRLQAELVLSGPLKPGNQPQAESLLRHALALARAQHARGWELRIALSLARLWQIQGRAREARELLAPIRASFTEGFNTQDLLDADILLLKL